LSFQEERALTVPIEVTVTGYERGTGPVVPYNGRRSLRMPPECPSSRVKILTEEPRRTPDPECRPTPAGSPDD